MGNMGSGRVYSLAAFVISLIIGALYFFEQYLLDHHEYLRIIEQSLRVCESWTCYRDANLVSHMKGYMWVRYVFSSLMGSQLKGAWLSLSFFFALFVSASFFIAYEKTKSVLSSLGFIFLLLLSWPLLQYEVLVGEDNLSYYGLFLWFLYFYYVNRKMMIAGALLGTMIFVHESPIAFLGLGASIPFYFFYERSKVKEHVVFIVASLVSFHLLFIPAYWDVLISKPIDLIFEYNPIQMHLSDALSLNHLGFTLKESMAREVSFSNYLSLFDQGLYYTLNVSTMAGNWGTRVGMILLLVILLWKGISAFKKKEIDALFLLACSLIPVFLYRPGDPERWDYLFICLSFLLYLNWESLHKYLKHSLVPGLFILQLYQGYHLHFNKTEIAKKRKAVLVKALPQLKQIKVSGPIVLDYSLSTIEPVVLSLFPKNISDIYFHDKEKNEYFKSKFSLLTKEELLKKEEYDDWDHFRHWQYYDLNVDNRSWMVKVSSP